MPSSKSYCVNSKVGLPQPHIEYGSATTSSPPSWSGWFYFAVLGIGAITLIICMNMLGLRKLFMQGEDPTAGLVPIVQQGELGVYPHLEGSNDGIESRFASNFTSSEFNLTAISDSLSKLLERYPKEHGTVYTNCWLENPKPEKPCFFDSTWVTDLCTAESSYGYEVHEEVYNPCIILKPEGTKNWIPRMTEDVTGHNDYGFVPVRCFLRNSVNASATMSVFPSKGFSHQFFPASKFDVDTYLSPLVAVKVNGIRSGDVVTVECSVLTPNAFILWNNGRVVITFSAD